MVEGLSQRLAREFREKIAKGEWTVGVRLPTTRQLAAAYNVSVNTIQSAFRELEASDLVERRPRLGGFVKPRGRGSVGMGGGGGSRGNPMRTATTIGVVGPYTDAGFHNEAEDSWGYRIIRGCDQELSPAGFHASMFSYSPSDPAAVGKVLERVDAAGETLGGVLCFMSPVVMQLLKELDARNVAWVTVNRPSEHAAQNFVSHDAFAAARGIGRCFARMGYGRALVLSDKLGGGRSSRDKYFGFMEGWVEAGREARAVDFIGIDGYEEAKGHDQFTAYVKRYGPPRGVFASGDLLAMGAIRACRELKIKVPEEVAVVGATGLQLAAYAHPSLTVLDTPMFQMGREAGQMLLEMAREGVRRMIGRYVSANIVVRESCPIPADLLAAERAAVEQSP